MDIKPMLSQIMQYLQAIQEKRTNIAKHNWRLRNIVEKETQRNCGRPGETSFGKISNWWTWHLTEKNGQNGLFVF